MVAIMMTTLAHLFYLKDNLFIGQKTQESRAKTKIMTYEQILQDFDKLGLKEDFQKKYEAVECPKVLHLVKTRDTLNSAATMIRCYQARLKEDDEFYNEVLHYLLTPASFRQPRKFTPPCE